MKPELLAEIKRKGYLPSPDILRLPPNILAPFVKSLTPSKSFSVLTEALYKKYRTETEKPIKVDLGESRIDIVKSFDINSPASNINSFVNFYNYRYAKISEFIKKRPEMRGAVSIKHLFDSQITGDVRIVGMVISINYTKNQNLMLSVEDPSGSINIIIPSAKKELIKKSSELVLDEVIGIVGSRKGQTIFANDIIFPDVASSFEYKKARDEVTAAFISDIHIGSIDFLEDSFVKFIDWTRGKVGSEKSKSDAKNLRYLFVTGDMVDGIGIYPGQDEELVVKDIYKQYEQFEEYIKQIPEHINIMICPGNHDAVRLEEPQPMLGIDLLKNVTKMKNVTLVSNPAQINIHGINGFNGLNVMMYHGYSFDYYCSENEMVRNNGGYDNISFVMEFLLRKRHLAPSHSSSPYITNPIDSMIIDPVPDIFVAGHTHKCSINKYKHIDIISSSCFQKTTSFQERLGHKPHPGLIPVLNLKNRQVTILNSN